MERDDSYEPVTPEMELNWAIHNDHADGIREDQPDEDDDDPIYCWVPSEVVSEEEPTEDSE